MLKEIKFKGTPVTLVGRILEVGDLAPDFRLVNSDLGEVGLSDFKGKIKIITSFFSIDTSVCDLQVKEFNRRASSLGSDVIVLAVSKDLPFAQKRFCSNNDIKNITVLSDYKFSSFGLNYGLLIKEFNLLARSVFILDKNNVVRYAQITEEIATPPNYEDGLRNLEEVIKNPEYSIKFEELPSQCKACEGGVSALPKEKIERLIAQYRKWQLLEDKKISKEFKFKDFQDAKYFLDLISIIADEQGHHPIMTIIYNKVKITLTTHSAGGLTENDFIMAKIIDDISFAEIENQ